MRNKYFLSPHHKNNKGYKSDVKLDKNISIDKYLFIQLVLK